MLACDRKLAYIEQKYDKLIEWILSDDFELTQYKISSLIAESKFEIVDNLFPSLPADFDEIDLLELRWNKVLTASAIGRFDEVIEDRSFLRDSPYREKIKALERKLWWRHLVFF